MNPENHTPQDDQSANFENEKQQYELEKLKLEVLELRRKGNFFKQPRLIFKAFVAVLVLAPLFWFYYRNIFLPIMHTENYELMKKTKELNDEFQKVQGNLDAMRDSLWIVTARLSSKQDSLEIYRWQLADLSASLDTTEQTLVVVNDSLTRAATRLVEQEKAYLQRIEGLRGEYKKLSDELSLTKKQRDEYQKIASELDGKIRTQRSVIADLNQQIKKAASGILQLRRQPDAALTASEVKSMLARFGFYCKETAITRQWSAPLGRGLNNQFVRRNSNLIVHDQTTGLQWQQKGSRRLNFESAKKYIARLNAERFAGFADWRLPTLEEAMSLMTPHSTVGGMHINPVFDAAQTYLWTADRDDKAHVWFVDFSAGICYSKPADDINYLRAVRTAKSQ